MSDKDLIPFWWVNVPKYQRTAECPPYLHNLSQKDISIISTPDSEYDYQTWAQVCEFAESNRLDLFQRVPSELRRYRKYMHKLQQDYGSVLDFIRVERLAWPELLEPRGRPFEYDDDFKILFNDWPYGVDLDIVHLVVWTKFKFEDDPVTGDLTDEARREIDAFVTKTFRSRTPADKVVWFKNWAALKSVHAVEHFHVMLLQPEPNFVKDVTNGDKVKPLDMNF